MAGAAEHPWGVSAHSPIQGCCGWVGRLIPSPSLVICCFISPKVPPSPWLLWAGNAQSAGQQVSRKNWSPSRPKRSNSGVPPGFSPRPCTAIRVCFFFPHPLKKTHIFCLNSPCPQLPLSQCQKYFFPLSNCNQSQPWLARRKSLTGLGSVQTFSESLSADCLTVCKCMQMGGHWMNTCRKCPSPLPLCSTSSARGALKCCFVSLCQFIMRLSAERGAGGNCTLCPDGRQSPMWTGECQEWRHGFCPALVNPSFCL